VPCIVILNGVGSVGKSATARALQTIAPLPFLHVSMDSFLEMLPVDLLDHPDGLRLHVVDGEDGVAVSSGPVLERAMLGMRHAVVAMAGQGNNLIVDDVMIGNSKASAYRALLSPFDTRWVGLFAPLDVLEARERARADRRIGLARWQYDRVHAGIAYDLTVDTTAGAPLAIAMQIRDAFGL
jgi:chloramphenicol 3-O phosphotransferase